MNDQARLEQEIRETLIIAAAGEASDQQLARLNRLVADNDQTREYVCRLMQQIGNIRWGARQNINSSLSAIRACWAEEQTEEELDQSAKGLPDDKRRSTHPAPPIPYYSGSSQELSETVLETPSDRPIGLPDSGGANPMRSMTLGRFSVVAGIVSALMLGLWIWPRNGGDRAREQASAQKGSASGSFQLLNVGEVRIDSGTARLRLPNVGYIIVDGPAELELVTPMRIRLDRGRIRVRVTEPTGHGFVVVTPHGEVVDLGTEFGVEVADVRATELVVFEGAVDLRMPGAAARKPSVERLTGGEGIRFGRDGRFERIMSINTGHVATFQRAIDANSSGGAPVILDVSDNLRTKETKRFYEIVHGGLEEDALAYVDRPYQWNGVDRSGMPEFLIGADYVKTFNDYKRRSFQITLELAQPADLYVFWDDLVSPMDWLRKDFVDTGLDIGVDEERFEPYRTRPGVIGAGPGVKVDKNYSIWRRRVSTPGPVYLGPVSPDGLSSISMYGIAAVAASKKSPATQKPTTQKPTTQKTEK